MTRSQLVPVLEYYADTNPSASSSNIYSPPPPKSTTPTSDSSSPSGGCNFSCDDRRVSLAVWGGTFGAAVVGVGVPRFGLVHISSFSDFHSIGGSMDDRQLPHGVHDSFGWSVAVGPDVAVVGSPWEDDGRGAAYVFRKDKSTGSWSNWQRLTAPNSTAELFGWSVSVQGPALLVSARGGNESSAVVFGFSETNSSFSNGTLLFDFGVEPADDVIVSITPLPINGSYYAYISAVYEIPLPLCTRAALKFSSGLWSVFKTYTSLNFCPVSASASSSSIAVALHDTVQLITPSAAGAWTVYTIPGNFSDGISSVALSPPLLTVGTLPGDVLVFRQDTSGTWAQIQRLSIAGEILGAQVAMAFPVLLAAAVPDWKAPSDVVAFAFAPLCGDGIIVDPAETCDDENTGNGDGCSANCTVEPGYWCVSQPSTCALNTCGDGMIITGEQCDDGNTAGGDGCSGNCTVEYGWICRLQPSQCTICGNGNRTLWEQCDDGNTAGGDGCSVDCTVEYGWFCNASGCWRSQCGDHAVTSGETCDDLWAPANGDGCSANCTVERGWQCVIAPGEKYSICSQVCGDGIITSLEQCDDGNTDNGDGCSSECKIEARYSCYGEPSRCIVEICGDGKITAGEYCDDGNNRSGDGCSNACRVELGYRCTLASPSVCSSVSCNLSFTRASTANCSCYGEPDGSISFNATGGTPPLTYAVARLPVDPFFQPTFSPNPFFSGLLAGMYRLYVRGADNCFVNMSAAVSQPPGAILTWSGVVGPTCYGSKDGKIFVNATIPNAELRYSLVKRHNQSSDGSSDGDEFDDNLTFISVGRWTSLTAGTYTVIVENGACLQDMGDIALGEPSQVIGSIATIKNVTTCISVDGAFGIVVTGGVPPFEFDINGTMFTEPKGLMPGTYKITIKDSLGCTSEPIYATMPSPPGGCSQINTWNVLSIGGIVIGALFIVIVVTAAILSIYFVRKKKLAAKRASNTILLENIRKYS